MKNLKKLNVFILLICLFVPLTFVGCKNTNKESLSTPIISEIKGGTIVFNQVSNAEYYTISINGNEVNVNTAYNDKYVEIIDNQINYDASKIFVAGNSYSVKVRANSSKLTGDYSSVYSYKHLGSISEPKNIKINGTTLTWDTVENASYYIVKFITPNDKSIYDKQGNKLTSDDPESIKNADINEFHFSTNRFDFGSILSTAGKYQFYVSAVLSNNLTNLTSDYSSKDYVHKVQLEIPTTGQVYKDNDENLHIVTAIDSNANAVSVKFDNVEKTMQIETEQSIQHIENDSNQITNLININLNKYFASDITTGNIKIDEAKQFKISVKSVYESTNPEMKYYIDSAYSQEVVYENTFQLSAPTLNLTEINENVYAMWETGESNLVSEYKLIVFNSDGYNEYSLSSQTNSMLITESFEAVAIQAIGKGNYLSSNLSEFVSNNTTSLPTALTVNTGNSAITWTNYGNPSYYIVEINNNFQKVDTCSFNLPLDNLNMKDFTMRVHVIKEGYSPMSSDVIKLSQTIQLETPGDLGFNSTKNLYELSFKEVENAIGYYVYIATGENPNTQDFRLIDKLYTTNKIDLYSEILTEGEYTDYSVKVVAVADPYSKYVNSDQSSSATVKHIEMLNAPEYVDANKPIIEETISGTTDYFLQFKEVQGAGSYEILINYNRLEISADDSSLSNGVYNIRVTTYFESATNYTIKIKTIPSIDSSNIKASNYNTATYSLIKQLPMVQNIETRETESVYTLTFDAVDNAKEYEVRIVKENDGSYSKTFTTSYTSCDVTEHVKAGGVYNFYITAIAEEGKNYINSKESSTCGTIRKLTTLNKPTNIEFANNSKTEYIVSWTGDEHADYYLIKIKDPHNLSYEVKSYETQANVNDYITVQGTYSFSIYSKVNATGENAKQYASSEAALKEQLYNYELSHDFERYSISMYGHEYDFKIDDVNDLKNILWYHYLYEMNLSSGLRINIQPTDNEISKQQQEQAEYDSATEENKNSIIVVSALKRAIVRMSVQATDLNLYNFVGENANKYKDVDVAVDVLTKSYDEIDKTGGDQTWYNMLHGKNNVNKATETELLKYLCEKLLSVYPEFNVLEEIDGETFHIEQFNPDKNFFMLQYKNALNGEKLAVKNGVKLDDNSKATLLTDIINYGNDFKYIDNYARKSATGMFEIDSREEMSVTTTEQLIHAVQYGYKPKFVGYSKTAETVYANAKVVLSAIVSNNMSDLEKVTAIFDWLEYGFELTYYSIDGPYISGTVEKDKMSIYGEYEHYYLEGIFNNISLDDNGNIIIGNKFATSWSYSKAFALLCGIEGIECVVVNGNYTYTEGVGSTKKDVIVDHVWNKVCLDVSDSQTEGRKWYNVDLTFSDNKIMYNYISTSYGISSHAYFLVSNEYMGKNIFGQLVTVEDVENNSNIYTEKYNNSDESYLISKDVKICDSTYDYYSNSNFGLTSGQIKDVDYDLIVGKGFNYSLTYNSETTYQEYSATDGFGNLENFLLNVVIYTKHTLNNNTNKRSVFELKYIGDTTQLKKDLNEDVISAINDTYGVSISWMYNSNPYEVANADSTSTIVVLCFKQ